MVFRLYLGDNNNDDNEERIGRKKQLQDVVVQRQHEKAKVRMKA
jgi:hypothetical protein